MPGGRPTTYNDEIAALICERVATHSCGLQRLCNMYDDMPDKTTIYLWRYKHEEFSHQYAEAKLRQADLLAEEMMDIADDGTNDWMETFGEDTGIGWKLNGEHVQRSRLRIDTRKWLAAKLLPKQYGAMAEEKKSASESIIEKLLSKVVE